MAQVITGCTARKESLQVPGERFPAGKIHWWMDARVMADLGRKKAAAVKQIDCWPERVAAK
jgi:hypothetical protein